MAVLLNIDGDNPNQYQEYQIEGVTYFIQTYYNVRSGWYMNFYDQDGVLLLGGVRCQANGLMTWRYSRSSGLFKGDILIADTIASEEGDISRINFGQGRRFQPWYFTKSEMDLYRFPPYLV